MPTGPGENILDALDAGTADKDIQSKYKINNDQLKAFKALHYGLSNQEMKFSEIKDYFPDINSYFTATGIEKPDFTKPVHEKAISESTSAPVPQTKYNKAAAESNKPVISLEQKFEQKGQKGMEAINKALQTNDDVLRAVNHDFKLRQAQQAGYDKFAASPRTDMPAASALANIRNNILPQEQKPEEVPVSDEELQKQKADIQNDPAKARQFINQVAVHKPEQAAELQSSMYLMDARQRLKEDPNIALKVNDNLNQLEKGQLKYNAVTGELQKELGPIDALVSGVKERTRQLENYKLFQGNDKDVIDLLEKRMAQYDPDKPVEMPKGFGEITQMAGMEWASLLKGMATGAITNSVGGEAAAPYISAAINAPEYYKRGYSTALEDTYSEARRMGKSPEEALKMAREQAKTEGNLGALEGGVSAFIGGRIGLKELPKFDITSGFKNAASQLLKHSVHFAGETTIEGLADGLTAGYLQDLKDKAATDKGLFRDSEKNIKDNVMGELTFSLAMGAMTHAGKSLVDPETYNKLKYYLGKQDQKAVQSVLGNMVLTGQVSKEDADNITKELNEQHSLDKTVPDDIKNISRQAILDKIKKRDELEVSLKSTDKALHPDIQKQIDDLNDEILEHSQHKKANNESKTKAEAQADAEADVKAGTTGIKAGTEQVSQPGAETNAIQGEGNAAPVGDMHYTNAEGISYVLRGDDLYRIGKDGKETKFSKKAMQTPATQYLVNKIKEANSNTTQSNSNQNAVQEKSGEGVQVPASFRDSQEVGARNESQGTINEEPTGKEEIEINNIDDLDNALANLAPKKVLQKNNVAEEENTTNSKPLPKLTESNAGSQTPISTDIKSYTPQSIIDKAKETFKEDPLIERVTNFLEPLIKANPNIRINHDADFEGKNALGYSHNDGSIDLNFSRHKNEGALLQTALHEMVHAVTRSQIENNSAFRSEIEKVLSKLREHLSLPDSDEGVKGAIEILNATIGFDVNKYGAANAHELIAELYTNQKFRDTLASIKYEGDSFLTKIFQTIAKYLSQAYNKLVDAKQSIKAEDLAEFLQQLTEKTVTSKQSDDSAGSLPMLASDSQEDALRKIIKKTPKSITDEQLKERIVAATGLPEKDVQDLIDEVRKPVVPPKPVIPTSILTKEERQVSINKINRLIDQPRPKEQSAFSKFWEGVKNASAWMDNPYRFITKITEDINKHYGLTNKEVIPLGRQFEKTYSGRAALKIDSYVNDIVRGNINDERLGILKGEKYKDLQRYLISKRVIDRLNKQEDKARGGKEVNRQTGNVTRQDAEVMLDELKKKYGNLDDFKKRGEAFQKHMDTMMQTLVTSGILSKEAYDNIKADNDFYAPFSVVQSKLLANQEKQSVGISGVVKRIKGIDYKLPTTQGEALTMINSLGDALNKNIISPEEYFNTSFQILNEAKNDGLITDKEFEQHISALENPGFAINDILDAGANMIYKAEGLALRNTMMQRLFAYKASDTQGLFIQDVDGFKAITLPDGTNRMMSKPLDQIKVEPGMAPIKLRVDGKDKIVAVNKQAADKLNTMSNYETNSVFKFANVFNKLFRVAVITLSPGFQVANVMIDFLRTVMLSRYGPLAGKGLVQPVVNAALFMPQYIEALLHSALGNTGFKTDTYKQWMNSDSFSKGMFDDLFDNEKRIKEVNAPLAKRILTNFIKLHWIDVPGSILEQTHKIATHQRGMSVEGFKPEMATAMLASIINRNINPNMSSTELKDGMDRLTYEVQNFAGSPNFPQTHKYMKAASMLLQFFSARVKGEMTDYRRVVNLISTLSPEVKVVNKSIGLKSGTGEGVKLSKQEAVQMGLQFMGAAAMIAAYAIRNNMKDEDEKEFDSIPPYHQANYLNIPLGYFDYQDEDGSSQKLRDYVKIPLRGLTATMNVMANSFVKYYKKQNPTEFKNMAEAFIGNASPVNLQGKDERELGESLASNLTPIFKYFIEYSFNRDTHNHRDIVPDYVTGKGMLSKYRDGKLKPWEVATKNTPQWAKDFSKFLYDNLGISISAIELNHMEDTMGNPTELYNKALKKRLFRSESKYPLYKPKEKEKNTSSATVTPTTQ